MINLGRLHTRAGDGTAAYQVLNTLFDTVHTRSAASIDGITFDAGHLVVDAEHPELVQWLWAVLLADGTRALTRAGRWAEASQHADQHHGVGTRLLDGRQVTIIAAHPQTALAMLAATDAPTPWERAVAACLTTICRIRLQQCTDADIAAMIDADRAVEPGTTDPVFHVRLGLTAGALAAGHPAAAELLARVEHTATATTDAYIARDVLAAAHLLPVSDRTMRDLTETAQQAGLGAGDIPPTLLDRLLHATDTAERLISTTVRSATRPAGTNPRRRPRPPARPNRPADRAARPRAETRCRPPCRRSACHQPPSACHTHVRETRGVDAAVTARRGLTYATSPVRERGWL